jgi:hypothetical protein
MSTMPQIGESESDDLRLLAYVHHMAQTAQSKTARRLFELFVQQESRRSEAQSGGRHSLSRHNGIGGA